MVKICNIIKPEIIIIIYLVKRHKNKNKKKAYLFVGDVNNNLKNTLMKLGTDKINSNDIKILKKEYPLYYKEWLKINCNVEIVNNKIREDDSIYLIKNKIFAYISKLSEDYYIIPNNQQIWFYKKDKIKVLGYYYETVENMASPYNKMIIDKKFVDNYDIKINNVLYNDNDIILMNELDIYNPKEHYIYVANLMDEIKFITIKKKTELNDRIINGYLHKYWPKGDIKFNTDRYKKYLSNICKTVNQEKYSFSLINSKDIDYSIIKNCCILQSILHVNHKYKNKDKKDYIDLLKIFNYIRDHISADMPFTKYKDDEWDKPYIAVHKKSVEDGIITKAEIVNWCFSKIKKVSGKVKTIQSVKGLQVRLYLYTWVNIKKYLVLNIYKDGKLEIKLNYKEDYEANFKKLEDGVNKVIKLIKEINNGINYNIYGDERKIEEPGFYVDKHRIKLKNNTKIAFIDTHSLYSLPLDINHVEFYNFIKTFSNFVVPILDEPSNGRRIHFKYRRVNNFRNMSKIFETITILREKGLTDFDIIIELEEEYLKDRDEIKKLLKDWKKRYGVLKNRRGLLKQYGIDLNIKYDPNDLTKNKIIAKGSKNIIELYNVNKFAIAITYMFLNINKYKKDKKFIKFIYETIDFSKISNEENIFNNVIQNTGKVNNTNNSDNDDIYKINDNNDEIYTEDFHNSEILDNININYLLEDKEDNKNTKIKFGEEISNEIKLSVVCDKPNYKIDTCNDICNDTYYYLRRLQRYDTRLFKFKAVGKYKSLYSKKCQSSQERQPVVLDSDPEKNSKIKRDSYTYSIKYGSDANHQYYYICPKVWCPTCNIPIKYSDLKKFEKRRGKKGSLCSVGKCPFGNHDAFIRENEYYSGATDKNKGGYPGFIDSTGHPDALCMPCCFAKPHNTGRSSKYKTYLKCLGEEYSDIIDDPNQIYILGKGFPIDENRYAILPPDINKLFMNECSTGYLKEGTSCYVRKGLNYLKNIKQSFLITIADLVSEDKKNPTTLQKLKKYLINNLTPDLFISLNRGLLNIKFKDPTNNRPAYENFKDYILSDQFINEEFLWDLLSRPNILYPDGINIIIMNFSRIICPTMYGLTNIYDINRPTYFIIKNNNIYEPIYRIVNSKTILYTWYFSGLNKIVSTIISVITKNCNEISYNWNYKILENQKKYNVIYDVTDKKEYNLIETIKILTSIKIKVSKQVLDSYNKVIGVITKKKIFIPCFPSELDINIKYDTKYLDQDYNKIQKIYKKISKQTELNLNVKYKILNNKMIIAVVLENGVIINVKEKKNINDDIKISNKNYYKDLDEVISKNIVYEDGRSLNVKKYEYEEESYNRLKYLLSKYLNKTNNIKTREELLKNIKDTNIDNIMKIIDRIFKKRVHRSSKINLDNYKVPNQRILCYKLTKCNDPHCIMINSKCLLNISKNNLLNGVNNLEIYKSMIAYELVYNKLRKDLILNNKIPSVINIKKLNESDKEILFYGKDILDKIDELYEDSSNIYISKYGAYELDDPPEFKDDPTLTIKSSDNLSETLLIDLINLSTYWILRLGDEYRYYPLNFENSSLFINITYIINKLSKEIDEDIIYNVQIIKDSLLDYIDNIPILYLKLIDSDMGGKGVNDILELYRKYYPNKYMNVYTIQELKNFIKDNEYNCSYIDIYLLSIIYNINIILLQNRITTKNNHKGYTCIGSGIIESSKYIIIYTKETKKGIIYNLVQKSSKIYFKYDELPKSFTNFISCISNIKIVKKDKNSGKKKLK